MPSSTTASSSQIEQYANRFRSVRAEAQSLVAGVSDEVLLRPPEPGRWSAAQCFDHLNTVGWLLLSRMERQINDAQEHGPFGEEPFRYGFVSRTMIWLMQPTSNVPIPAPSSYTPDAPFTLQAHTVVTEFLQLQDDLVDCVHRSKGLDLRRVRVPSPAAPILTISLGAWYEATIAHERRHLAQAESAVAAVRAIERPPE